MLTGFVLVVVAVVFRFAAPQLGTWNFVPMAAVRALRRGIDCLAAGPGSCLSLR